MHYILIDYENVQPDIWHIADDFEVDVTVFVGPRQRVNPKTSEAIHRMDTRGEVIKVCNAGPKPPFRSGRFCVLARCESTLLARHFRSRLTHTRKPASPPASPLRAQALFTQAAHIHSSSTPLERNSP